MLADGTGGFVIANTNDLLGGLQKISKDQNEYYLLAYAPPESVEGSCHTIRVKVNKGGMNVRARRRVLQCETGGPALGQADREGNGNDGGGHAAGHDEGGADAGAVLLHLDQYGAGIRGDGHSDAPG